MTIRPLPILFCLLLLLSCKWLGKKEQPQSTTVIKNKPSTEMPIPALPLTGDYADDWKIVDSLENAGLFKSALEKMEAIQARAKNDKNSQQVVKALLFRGKYITQLEEEGLTKAIQTIETEAKSARAPEKAVLQSILGQLYATYLQSQGWNLQQRTPIPDGEGGDILTWSAAQIERHALELYSASVAQDALLKSIPVEQFRDITTPGVNDSIDNKSLRPTLFDLLAHRALEHFSNDRSYLTEPAYAFVLNQEVAFANAAAFVAGKFETKDSTSGKWLAIKVLQKIVGAQIASVTSQGDGALIDAELHRLQFVHNNSTLENREALYQKALETLHNTYFKSSSNPEIVYALAAHLYALETGNKGENAKSAVALLEDAIRRHPNTYGAKYCQQLLEQIRATIITTNIEQVNLPAKNILVQVGFRNLKKVWVKVVQDDFDREKWAELDGDQQFQRLNSARSLQNRSWDIQDPGDFQSHQTEIALDGLPFGSYWVFISDNAAFDPQKGPVNYSEFVVSNIAAVSYNERGQTHFVLADRTTGAPTAGVKLDFFQFDYNSGRRKIQKIGTSASNRDGFAKSEIPQNVSVQVLASLGKDTLWIGQAYRYQQGGPSDRRAQVQFFTDRAMYRPGQTVYFKGLAFRRTAAGGDTRQLPQIVPNQAVTVKFFDANGQMKSELKLKSNEFGTFNGSFAAPATGLTGQMSIQADAGAWGAIYFNVEEYKRPRFEVTMKPVEGAFRVNDKITVRGEAKNYAGSVVDGAQVRYRVVRVARFPFWDYYRSWKLPAYFNVSEMEITNGTTTSGIDGAFAIDFIAIPDAAVPKKDQPIFDYQVFVDVTDITGETRSNSSSVSAAYVALQVDWNLPNEINLDSLRRVGVHTTNMAGQKQAAEGQITLQRLVAPKVFYKDRLWERPDITTLGKSEFDRMFPDLAWKAEDDPTKWGREDFTRTIPFNTATSEIFDLHEGRSQPGWYVARLVTKDAFGEKIEIERFVRVWDKETQFEKPSAQAENASYEPGETAKVSFGGKPQGLYFFFAQERGGDLQKPEWISSHLKGLSTVEIKISENDRGGVAAHWFAIKDNRLYGVGQVFVNVPWSNKDLKISYETFRDKLAPGQKEEWRIKISGPKKDKVAAEMVAALYDASLDQFRANNWSPVSFPMNYAQISFGQTQNFGANGGSVRFDNLGSEDVPYRSYRSLNWFDFPMWGRPRYAMMERSMAPEGAAMGGEGVNLKKAMKQERNEEEIVVRGSRQVPDSYALDGIRVSGGAPPVPDMEAPKVRSATG